MRKLVLYILIAIVPLLSFCSGGIQKNEVDKAASINLIAYNIRMNTPNDGVNAWPLRKDKVIGLLSFHKADIFGVQEALPEQVQDLIDGFPEFDNIGIGRDDGVSAGEHMSIFYRKSRFEKLDGGTFWLNESTDKPGLGWDAAHNRTCTWIKLKDKTSGVYFTFLILILITEEVLPGLESAKLVIKFMEEINDESLPLILMGDFNAVNVSEPIAFLLKNLTDTRSISKTEPYGPPGTSGGFEVKEKSRVIDFIFVNDQVGVKRHGHLSDSFGLFYPSDHLPVLAEIYFNL
jgi:endonuclease/exonuclease/phosphatase family metal-dependent hydrolase